MTHISTSEANLDGVTVRAVIEQSADHPDYVVVTLNVRPGNPGMDAYPYSALIKKPEGFRQADR